MTDSSSPSAVLATRPVAVTDSQALERAGAPSPFRRRTITRVRDVMSADVVTAPPDSTLPQLLDLMLQHGISGIPIIDEDRRLVGIVTEADLISKPAYGGTRRRALSVLGDALHGRRSAWAKKSRGLSAADIMTNPVRTAHIDDDVRVAARTMVEAGVKRLPVVDGGPVVGLVSRSDVLRAMHRSDRELEDDLVSIFADEMRIPEAASVEASVVDGVVTLRGTVLYPIDLPVLSSIVWRLPGVVDVRNEVRSTEPNPTPSSRPMSDYDYLRYFR